MKVIESLEMAYLIRLGEKLNHPVFGKMEVMFIYQGLDYKYDMLCKLFEFNDTLKTFDALDLSKLKFKTTELRRIK